MKWNDLEDFDNLLDEHQRFEAELAEDVAVLVGENDVPDSDDAPEPNEDTPVDFAKWVAKRAWEKRQWLDRVEAEFGSWAS